jgi:glutamate synthase (NADPH/NADH) large chain
LYAPDHEHDACGVAMVADLAGRRDHGIVVRALTALLRLEHRGARGSEPDTGDGAGILIQIPDEFFRAVVDFELPEAGAYAAGTAFLPTDAADADAAVAEIDRLAAEEGLRVLGWRELPTAPQQAGLGPTALAAMPAFRQLFVAGAAGETGLDLERRTFCLRKRAEHARGTYFPSLSPRTIVYKGMLTEPQVEAFYPDLSDERVRPRWPWCTRGSPPTPSRPGRWPTRTGTSRTTGDQHPARQPQLDGRARGAARVRHHPGDLGG